MLKREDYVAAGIQTRSWLSNINKTTRCKRKRKKKKQLHFIRLLLWPAAWCISSWLCAYPCVTSTSGFHFPEQEALAFYAQHDAAFPLRCTIRFARSFVWTFSVVYYSSIFSNEKSVEISVASLLNTLRGLYNDISVRMSGMIPFLGLQWVLRTSCNLIRGEKTPRNS